jgi:hypothetical protein
MSGPTQKPAVTLAEYNAAAQDLRKAADRARVALKEAHAAGDVAQGDKVQFQLQAQFDAFRAFRERIPRDVLLSIHADRILESFSVDKENFVTLTIPADVSDEDAMHALNGRFREMFPEKERAAIYEPEIEQILDAGDGSGRISRAPRIIKLIGVVPGTTSKTRDQQAAALEQKGLTFPHPIEQALAAAAYSCKRSGEDLFNDLSVRGSVPGFALYTNPDRGVHVHRCYVGIVYDDVAASGSPSPELKNLDR